MSNTLRIGIPFLEPVWPYVDPATDFTPISLNVVYATYERLVELTTTADGQLEITAGLARTWTVSDDQRTYVFEIDADARFASGRPVTADDVVFSFDRLMRMAEPPSHLFPISQVRALEAGSVEIVLERGTVAFLTALASPAGSIVERAAVEVADDLGRHWLTRRSAGSGRFVLQTVTDDNVILVADPHHWRGRARADQVEFVDTPDADTALAKLRSDELDLLLAVAPADFGQFVDDADFVAEQVASIQCPNLTLLKGTVGPDGRSLTANRAFTQALKYAVDYDDIAGLFGGWGDGVRPAQAGFIPIICGYDEDLAAHYRHDPEKASELLRDAGYADGIEVDFPYWEGSWSGVDTQAVVEALERDLRAVGIRPRLTVYSGEEYFSLLLDQRVMTGLSLSMSVYQMPDPEDVVRRKMTYLNLTGYELDAQADLDAAAAETDAAARSARYQSLQRKFLEENPMIFLLTYPHRVVRHQRVSGYRHLPHRPGPDLAELAAT
jgi:peptide/nickel transport system substrate-binding protein